MSGSGALRRAVDGFVVAVAPALTRLAGDSRIADTDKLSGDVALEAFNLTAAFVDADGRHTDDELDAFIDVFGPRFDTVARAASPSAMRAAGLLAGSRTFLDVPSSLFELLVHADARDGGIRAWTYYTAALDIAHTVLALDAFPAHAELSAVERFRSALLRGMDGAGVRRPGGPQTQASTGPTRPSTSAAAAPPVPTVPAGPPRPIDELLAELDALVGLAPVKAEVKLVTDLLRVEKLREARGLPVVEHSRHLVFTGNPGTGKTTVARLLAQIYRTLGVVEKGQLVETDRSGLVAGYIGQTSIKVKEVFTRALGGVLLIDEAHALARGQDRDFGHEAIDMIVKLMEDHRDQVVVIVAGYPDEMAVFLDANPGLRSRFPKTIFFPDYTDAELASIFEGMCRKSHYVPTAAAQDAVLAFLGAQARNRGFGNARLVRNLFEAVVARQASRVVARPEAEVTDDALVAIEAVDVNPEAPPEAQPEAAGAAGPDAPAPSPGPTP
ncbi:MAG TPA: AAA family ATPase [Acidimicrobiales bacterium]